MPDTSDLPVVPAPRTPPKVVIFDFDGVVLDSAELKLQAYAALYADEDREKVRAVLAHARLHGGITRRVKLSYYEREIFGRPGGDDAVDALAARYARLVYQAVLDCPFIAGAEAILARGHGTTAMHVVSGTPDGELKEIVAARGLKNYFRSVRGAPATKPEAFAAILASETCSNCDALAIGDSMTEYLAAEALGIPFLGIVPPHAGNPFPRNVRTLPDLSGLEHVLDP